MKSATLPGLLFLCHLELRHDFRAGSCFNQLLHRPNDGEHLGLSGGIHEEVDLIGCQPGVSHGRGQFPAALLGLAPQCRDVPARTRHGLGSRKRNACAGFEPQESQCLELRGIGRIPHLLHQAGQGVDFHPPAPLDVDHGVAVTPCAFGQRFVAEITGYAQLSKKLGVVHAGFDAAPSSVCQRTRRKITG